MKHAIFNGVIQGEDRERYDRLLVFLGESYKVRSTRIGSGHSRYGIEVEEVGTSTIYKIEGRTIEQVCDSTVTHIIQDRVGRPVSETAGTSTTFGPFTATASGMGGSVISEKVLREIEDMMKKTMTFKGSGSWNIKEK